MLIALFVLCILTCEAFLWSSIQIILLAVSHVMGILRVPMFLAQSAVLCILEGLLEDSVTERDHPFLGRTTFSCICFGPFTFLVGWIGCQFLGTIQRM